MVWEHVKICGVQINEKCIHESKTENIHFHTTLFPSFFPSPFSQREIYNPPRHSGGTGNFIWVQKNGMGKSSSNKKLLYY